MVAMLLSVIKSSFASIGINLARFDLMMIVKRENEKLTKNDRGGKLDTAF